ncbi:N-acetylmuramoyl-L-alanine amidase [Culicoidibacter larvae]|uniref:MurNAc-LAA domain-containing protein n=1 Tax=Culicoidibacter larvae TaxID=2579976 RepID=A0A5R8Q7M4_9FIRM|nr:N-acetylmuramoyl-L-alanine amidase [Culicoidibacter larvae]TLG71358.1 hypothetical protein FEZ08_10715 [Culicoidibacter larvae]
MKTVALFTSHYGTVGAGGGGRNEEELMREYTSVVENYAHQNGGFNCYRFGLTEHEMDIDDHWINNGYDLVLSHHMDGSTNANARGGHMCYCQNPALIKKFGDIFGKRFTEITGTPWNGNKERCDLDMVNGDSDDVPRGLLELGFITNTADRDGTGYNQHALAKAEVKTICEVLGIPYTLDGGGSSESKPQPPASKLGFINLYWDWQEAGEDKGTIVVRQEPKVGAKIIGYINAEYYGTKGKDGSKGLSYTVLGYADEQRSGYKSQWVKLSLENGTHGWVNTNGDYKGYNIWDYPNFELVK